MHHSHIPGRILSFLLVLPLLAACETQPAGDTAAQDTAAAETMDPAELRSAIEAANQEFQRLANQDSLQAAVERIYTADATILPPGGPATTGTQNIATFWSQTAQDMGMDSVHLSTVTVESLGPDRAYEIGRWDIFAGDQAPSGKYVVIWQRGDDGQWRWDVDIWNENSQGLQPTGPAADDAGDTAEADTAM